MLRTGIVAVASLIVPALAQSPAFEVASVKPQRLRPGSVAFENANALVSPKISGNRITVSGSLSRLIQSAYNIKGNQILGAPDWATIPHGDVYDIVAKAEGDGTPSLDQVRLMLQTLLTDRFQLTMHRDRKELPVYELVIGKTGSKLKESASDATPSSRITPGPLTRLTMTSKSSDDLAQVLSTITDRPVVDKTGLKGFYDFSLEAENSSSDPIRTSILTAVQDQLGLKLNAVNEPTDVFLIDRVEKLSGN